MYNLGLVCASSWYSLGIVWVVFGYALCVGIHHRFGSLRSQFITRLYNFGSLRHPFIEVLHRFGSLRSPFVEIHNSVMSMHVRYCVEIRNRVGEIPTAQACLACRLGAFATVSARFARACVESHSSLGSLRSPFVEMLHRLGSLLLPFAKTSQRFRLASLAVRRYSSSHRLASEFFTTASTLVARSAWILFTKVSARCSSCS